MKGVYTFLKNILKKYKVRMIAISGLAIIDGSTKLYCNNNNEYTNIFFKQKYIKYKDKFLKLKNSQ